MMIAGIKNGGKNTDRRIKVQIKEKNIFYK